MDDKKKPAGRGGAGRGQGRKKNEARVAVEKALAVSGNDLDGRTVGGKEHAQWLIEQLNQIDPVMMGHLHLSVSLDPIEVPEDTEEKERGRLEQLEAERRARLKLRQTAERSFGKLSFELQGWAHIWFAPDTHLEVRKYLHDKAGHQAIRVINHVHDTPLEVHATLSLGEGMKLAMEKAEKRVASRR